MSPSLHLGLQSCLEPRLMEPRPSKLKFDPPKSPFSDSNLKNSSFPAAEIGSTAINKKESEMGGWNFLRSLSSRSIIFETESEEDKIFVYPLSVRSLEMCTESLGSETGSDESKSSDGEEIRPFPPTTVRKNPRKQSLKSKRMKTRADFPPPLTSISGHGCVRMKAHRENGRLVLKAEAGACCRSVFEVERGNGRLRLRLVKNCSVYRETQEPEEVEEEEEDTEGISEIMGVEMGNEKFPMPGRCNEGGTGTGAGSKRLLEWAEPFWVAT